MATPSTTPLIVRFYDPNIRAANTEGRTLDDILGWNFNQLEHRHDYIQWLFPLPEGSKFNDEAPIINDTVLQEFRNRAELRSRLHQSFVVMLKFYGFRLHHTPASSTTSASTPTVESVTKTAPAESTQGSGPATEGATSGPSHGQPEPGGDQRVHSNDDVDRIGLVTSMGGRTGTTTLGATDTGKIGTITTTSTTLTPRTPRTTNTTFQVGPSPYWDWKRKNWYRRHSHNHLRISRIIRSLRVLGLGKEAAAFDSALEPFTGSSSPLSLETEDYWKKAATNPLHITPTGEKIDWLMKELKQLDPGAIEESL
jgi:hypothetical protein